MTEKNLAFKEISLLDVNDDANDDIKRQKIEDAIKMSFMKSDESNKNTIVNNENYDVKMTEQHDNVNIVPNDMKVKDYTKKPKKKPKKMEIIEQIKLLSKKMGEPCDSDRNLGRTKLVVLKKKLAELTGKGVNQLSAMQTEIKQQEIKDEKEDKDGKDEKDEKMEHSLVLISDETAINSLFNYNIILANSIEEISKSLQNNETIGNYVPNLDGYTKQIYKRENELREALKLIVQEHGEIIKPYLSPIMMYTLIMITAASNTIMENSSKNLTES